MKILLFAALMTSSVWAHEYLETKSHAAVAQKIRELNLEHGSREVLVVFDIDNTLLKSRQPLGSDQWFEWQAEAIKQGSSDAIFRDVNELLAAQSDFFQLSSMALTETNLPEVVNELKRAGNKITLLTSRSPSLRNVTERELKRNNLWFSENTLSRGLPYEYAESPFKNPVSYMNGIFMSAGHHKGEALAHMIKKFGRSFKAIVFIDDHERHTKRVYETFSSLNGPEIITYRYGKEDESVQSFKKSSKSSLNSMTRDLMRTYRSIFKI